MAFNGSTRMFWTDWAADPALRASSFAAKGLWIDVLAYCGMATRYGYLEFAEGAPATVEALAEVLGKPVAEITTLLYELEMRGVFSRDKRGCIYNRRMVREAKRLKGWHDSGKKGGNPDLKRKKAAPKQAPDAENEKMEPNATPSDGTHSSGQDKGLLESSSSSSSSATATATAREEDISSLRSEISPNGSRPKGRKPRASVMSEAEQEFFDEFWRTYPSRGPHPNPKKPAAVSFRSAISKGADPGDILNAAHRYALAVARTGTDPCFVAQAVTWLRQERWKDTIRVNGKGLL